MKILRFLCVVAMTCFVATGRMVALDQVDGVYQIGTGADLLEFSNLVNGGEITASAVLTADIDCSDITMVPIGNESNAYKGKFDGQGHRILNMNISSSDNYQGLFGVVNGGALIENLIVDATCSVSGGRFVGGVVAGSLGGGTGTVTIRNVGNEANVTATGENAAGIFGVCMSSSCVVHILNCYNTGNVTGNRESGIITGWIGGSGIIKNFWNTGSVLAGIVEGSKLWRGTAETAELYDSEGSQGTSFDVSTLATGEFAYATLNGTKSDTTCIWYQNIDLADADADAYPVPLSTHGIVYPKEMLCDSTAAPGTEYTNYNTAVVPEHVFTEGVCEVCSDAQPGYVTQASDGFYEINDANQLNWFAHLVNKGAYVKYNARLMNDIDFSDYTSSDSVLIGVSANDFTGIFDGQQHTIIIDYTTGGERTALFRYSTGATIKNLIVEGVITSSSKFNAGIASTITGDTIENCITRVEIVGTYSGDATHGGIVAVSDNSLIKNCAFLGTITSPASGGSSGLVGYSNTTTNIVSCYMGGTLELATDTASVTSMTIGRNACVLANCYYLDPGTSSVNTGAIQVTEDEIASGSLCYKLNGMRSDTVGWYQNIDLGTIDEMPLPFSDHNVVYAVGTVNCDGSPAESEGFSNTNNSVQLPHNYVDGVCDFCNKLEPNYMSPNDSGFYEISTPAQMRWFGRYATEGHPKINGKLMADIDFKQYTNEDSIKIGSNDYRYGGEFDGNGHVVEVNYDTHTSNTALFAYVSDAYIHNLAVTGNLNTSAMCAAGIVSWAWGASVIDNCLSDVDITCSIDGDATIGGIIAVPDNNYTLRNSAFTGSIVAEKSIGIGGVVSWSQDGTQGYIENCFMVAPITAAGGNVFCRNNPTITNCYVIDPGTLEIDTRTIEFTSEGVSNGEMCYLLNKGVSGGTPWVQTIGTDEIPYPGGDHLKVYATGTINCDGLAEDLAYSNTEGQPTVISHDYDSEGICNNCGSRLISNATQLTQLAEDISLGVISGSTNVTLANDIDMSGITTYRGLGTMENPFTGTFDGQGYHIKNLVIDDTVSTGRCGLIGVAGNECYVKDVTIDSTCSISAVRYAAGIIGSTLEAVGLIRIENCGNQADVTVVNQNAGGIIGVNMGSSCLLMINNSYNAGDITGNTESAGLSGWLGSGARLDNCYSVGNVAGLEGSNTFARSLSYWDNCYETFGSQVDSVDMASVANGKLCYLLNNGSTDGPYYQTIGVDPYPVLDASHASVVRVINGTDTAYTNDPNSIEEVKAADKTLKFKEERIYSEEGVRLPALKKGINIIIRRDGTREKILVTD